MQFNTLQDAQQYLKSFSDPIERQIAEATLFGAAPPSKKHIVVLLHGMNTNAEWQEALAEPMRNYPALEPTVVGYGNFNPIKFWLPFVFRPGRIRKVLTDLEGIREREPDADISIVAHSFGTYIVSQILASASSLKFHRIMLCGSIVDSDYNWRGVSKQFTGQALNDIGRKDIWPSMAKSCTWGFGNSGCIGFQNSLVRDRHFTYGHSGFLNVKHMRRYWLPYLLDGKIVPSAYSRRRKPMGACERFLRWIPLKYPFAVMAGLALWKSAHWLGVPSLLNYVVHSMPVPFLR